MERKFEYIGFREKYCDIVNVGCDWFDYRNDEEDLPKAGAFCKTCAKEIAKPVYPIYMNRRPAYALQCNKCKNEYPMYKDMYITRYIGYDLKSGGHVNPTHGLISHVAAMDKKARDNYNKIPQRVEDHMCETFGYTHEEYRAIKKQCEKDSQIAHKRIENERAEFQSRINDNQRQEKSNTRKELIAKGILKYVKNVGLVNTETGEVIKL